jgi:hypothetical protein
LNKAQLIIMKNSAVGQFAWAVTMTMCFGVFGALGADATFKITKIEYDKTAKQVLLVWSSDANRTYTVEASVDLTSWQAASDTVTSGGVVSTYKILRLLSDNQSFFRIRENAGSGFQDPVMGLGHGAFLGSDGKEFTPTADFIEQAQQAYISNIISRVERGLETQQLIQGLVTNAVLANALLLDWLLERAKPDNLAHLTAVNNGLRWYYVNHIQSDPIRPNQDNLWSKGISEEIARQLEMKGVSVFLKTDAGGEAYRQECAECGVPVPPPLFSPAWRRLGVLDNPFISTSLQAELWIHEAPNGVCLALPRYIIREGRVTDEIKLFGVICLGIQTSKVCFFDNPNGTYFTRNVEVPISQFRGGVDLVANGQGVCSDCHAGENPFVIHPQRAAFAAIGRSLMPLAWPDPKVDASWPQNPGPTALLDAVSSSQSCTSCHRVGSAGRFPDVSTQLPCYCAVVLGTATGTSSRQTMPLGGDRNQYINHISALLAACRAPPTGGGVVVDANYADDPGYISAPLVEPAYQCGTKVSVKDAILDARLNLFVNGAMVATVFPARNPSQIDFDVPPLVAGDTLTANQEYMGVVSAFSAPVVVRDYRVDFPAGLPAPSIDPTLIYECASIIAVRHVPSATITVYKNGVATSTVIGGGTGWTSVYLGPAPFMVGDEFTAEISMCGDPSPRSMPVERAVGRPSSLPPPTLNPPTTYTGQELVTIETLVNGSLTTVSAGGAGTLGQFSTPVSWYPNFDVATPLGRRLTASDRLSAVEKLCDTQVGVEFQPAQGCEALPAPRIRHPLVGNNYVVVESAVPGARIRVYDDTGVELGDGSGTVIILRRALTGTDVLTVIQQLGDCVSRTGYRVYVRNASAGN